MSQDFNTYRRRAFPVQDRAAEQILHPFHLNFSFLFEAHVVIHLRN